MLFFLQIGFFGPASKRAELARRYQESYYARFPGSKAWCQGDFISRHPTNHTLHIHGRSDGVLNPVRMDAHTFLLLTN